MSETPDVALAPWAWIKLGAVIAAVLVVAGFGVGRCTAPDPAPLPAPVQHDVDRHVAQKAADSATIQLLTADTLAKAQTIRALADSEQRLEAAAHTSKDSADRLAAAASLANTAETWHAAYTVRTREADGFQRALMVASSRLFLLDQKTATTATIGTLYKNEAQLGDVVIQELLPLAEQRDRCRFFFDIIKCPTRKEAFAVGLLAPAAVYGGYELARFISRKGLSLGLFTLKF